jgi:N-acetylmuramic acid 6-phosphate etherase
MRLHKMSAAECVRFINEEDGAVLTALCNAGPALAAFIEAVEPRFLQGGRLIYVGAGTSGRLGVLDASEAPPTFCIEPGRIIGIIAGGDAALRTSSEGKEDDPDGAAAELDSLSLSPLDTVLGIAAGGTTPYVLGALEIAKRAPRGQEGTRRPESPAPLTGLLTCSPIPHPAAADHLLLLQTGPEVLTGSTRMKAGTATKLALNTISTTLMVRSGRVYENLMVDVKASNAKLRDRAARIVSTLTGLDRSDALELLSSAGGAVKTAVAMHRLNVPRNVAEKRLADASGQLATVLPSE